ncbi:MAG: tetratricopeptide repeat protein [Firmicutes bacterium]|nr:tetratricopeptide repeat protein [Bacillota bacterium]
MKKALVVMLGLIVLLSGCSSSRRAPSGKASRTPSGMAAPPGEPAESLALAGRALADGDWQELIRIAESLRGDEQYTRVATHMLATAHLMLENYNDNLRAAIALQKMRPKSGELSEFYKGLSSEYPASPHVFLALGDAHVSEGNLRAALQAFEEGMKLNDRNPQILVSLAVVKRNLGKSDEAMELYQKAIQIDDRLAHAHVSLGAAYLAQRKYSDAERVLRRATELRGDYALAWVNLGLACRARGSLDQAITCYQKSISLVPEHASAYLNLGAAYYYKKDYAGAREAWGKAVELDPDGPTGASARRNLARLPR